MTLIGVHLITSFSGHKSRVLETHMLKIRKILNASLLTEENEQKETIIHLFLPRPGHALRSRLILQRQ